MPAPLLIPPLLLLAPALLAAGSAAGQSSGDPVPPVPLPVQEFVLENGMHFLVLPREGAPTVSFVVHYPVGSVREAPGSTGLAHLVEHMLFKGTTTVGGRAPEREAELFVAMDAAQDTILMERSRTEGVPGPRGGGDREQRLRDRIRSLEDEARMLVEPGEFDAILSRNGARDLNATTSHEATNYFVELPANRAELWFVLESDRLRNPVFREFYTERDVVIEERQARVETSPAGRLNEAYLAAAFPVHPYGLPVVGLQNDLENLTRAQVETFYRDHYVPAQTVVAVVGHIEPDSIRAWAERYFGDLPARPLPPPLLVQEPEQRGARRVEVLFDAEPQLRMGWKIPSETHGDTPALQMLSAMLAGGRTSHLHRSLVLEDRVATVVSASLGPGGRSERLFTIGAAPRAVDDPEAVIPAITGVIERLKEELVTEEELSRVRNQLEASRVRRLRSNSGLAFQLAESQGGRGDWRDTFRFPDRLMAVTAEEIREVARRYLHDRTLTVAVLRRGGAG